MSRSWAKGSTRQWRTTRLRILKRDGYCCQRCGTNEGKLHIDHIVPKRLNGSDLDENLQTLCEFCNLSKGGRFFSIEPTPPTLHVSNIPLNVSLSHE
ncbi:HNHc domain containing protein [uncultured Caudovirales phage]|uniref:HNHc domain containing protein n=1 Tax=uncultured Caudovirales phage TaxID=2100421 RepID=A0A6J5P8F8_9CAUD|nr:HNHc domain containing protein [uncultured Caudovirales phage]